MGALDEEARAHHASYSAYNGNHSAGNVAVGYHGPPVFSHVVVVVPRLLVLILSTLALALLVTSKETKQIANLKIKANWFDAKAFISLASLNGICLGYSLLQTIRCLLSYCCVTGKLCGRRRAAWLTFAADQLLAYALVSSASASAEVAFIAKNGQSSAGWSEVCTTFDDFCNRVGVSLVLSFLSSLTLAATALLTGFNALSLHLR